MPSYTSQYPTLDTSHVKATTSYPNNNSPDPGYVAYRTCDPNASLTGTYTNNQWVSGENQYVNQRFHIDLGSAFVIKRIYYENGHLNGGQTTAGIKTVTFWGSNDSGAFSTLTYGTDTNWTQLTLDISTFVEHVALDQADPQYAIVTNTTAYRYYALKIADNWGFTSSGNYMDVRRIELQTIDNLPPNTPTNTTPANAATNVSRNPTLVGSAYSDPESNPQTASQFQVATDSGFTSVVWDSGTAGAVTSLQVTTGNGTFAGALAGKDRLAQNTQYYWRCKYSD